MGNNENKQKIESFDSRLQEQDYEYSKKLDECFLNDFDPEDQTTKFTEQDYANLQRNLVLFKSGNREATEYIISSFHRFLHAYTHFIVLHKIPHYKVIGKDGKTYYKTNPSILSFISLFSKQMKNNKTYKEKADNKKDVKNACDYIYSLFSKFEYGDIYNELTLALLNMANKYKIITDKNDPRYKPNGTFHVYVQKCFHFEAFHFLKNLCNDPLLNANLLAISPDDENDYDEEGFQNTVVAIDEKSLAKYNLLIDCVDRQIAIQNTNLLTVKEEYDESSIFDDDSLNFNWINGVVCDDVFKSLTSYERELLILSYVRNQTEDTLANLYGCSRATIGSHKRRAIKKIKDNIENNKNKE